MFNPPEFHFSEVTFFQNWYFSQEVLLFATLQSGGSFELKQTYLGQKQVQILLSKLNPSERLYVQKGSDQYGPKFLMGSTANVSRMSKLYMCSPYSLTPKRPGLLEGVLFGEMKFVLSNFLSREDLSISYES